MFGRYYFGNGGDALSSDAGGSGASAASIWAYTLSNGKSAAATLVQAADVLTEQIQGQYTVADILRILAAVAAGKTTITPLGGELATVEFEAIDDSVTTVSASMDGSERTSVTLTPTESS